MNINKYKAAQPVKDLKAKFEEWENMLVGKGKHSIPDEIEGALGKVLNAHKIICEAARFIGNNLLFCGFGPVLSISQYGPYDQFDLFEYLDEPIASKETIEKLREFWEKYRRETEQWDIQ